MFISRHFYLPGLVLYAGTKSVRLELLTSILASKYKKADMNTCCHQSFIETKEIDVIGLQRGQRKRAAVY